MASSFSLRSQSSCSFRSTQAIFIAPTTTPTRCDNGLLTVRYEEAVVSKPPIAVTVPPPTHPPTDLHPAFRISLRNVGTTSLEEYDDDDEDNCSRFGDASLKKYCIEHKRDSGMANIRRSRSDKGLSFDVTASSSSMLISEETQSLIGDRIDFDAVPHDKGCVFSENSSLDHSEFVSGRQQVINVDGKATEDIEDSRFSASSLIKTTNPPLPWKANNSTNQVSSLCEIDLLKENERQPNTNSDLRLTIIPMATNDINRSSDTERESRTIRLRYELGSTNPDADICQVDDLSHNKIIATPGQCQESISNLNAPKKNTAASTYSQKRFSYCRYQHELAGGIEDWENIDGSDVDRYGFIKSTKVNLKSRSLDEDASDIKSNYSHLGSEIQRNRSYINKLSMSLMPFQSIPNRRISIKSFQSYALDRLPIRATSGNHTRPSSTYLPINRHRRLVEEAGDMLATPLKSLALSKHQEKYIATDLIQKEWKRVDKWRKMAKVNKSEFEDDGMKFEFDVKSPRLIKRTWKGIPDRWRAAAWYSFLRTSAKKRDNCPTVPQIVQSFYQLLDQSSADDVQIDIDVPRTINSHIMFRTRYRGGQRLLFRVLHCLSLYFPRTGYVQGMASLAATLLCYYDEEKTFIMLVRLWTLRGMDRLYNPGFQNLLSALEEFQTKWMSDDLVAKKLENLNIEPTVYGTRWYLTLFNYSVPFSSLLRVWDIFMLLGDPEPNSSCGEETSEVGFPILHAISAALIDATRQTLLESDFETIMKTLTTWIPIKDDELLMKVVRAELKLHKKK